MLHLVSCWEGRYFCVHSKRNSDGRRGWGSVEPRWVGGVREEGSGALGATCFLNKDFFPCSVFSCWPVCEQMYRRGGEEVPWGGDTCQVWR